MGTSFRSIFAVLLMGTALVTAALAPAHSVGHGSGDFLGAWITWAGGAEGGERPVCRRLYVTAEGAATRDGAWDAPGWNGVVSGTVSALDADTPVWRGEWRDGQIAGTFTLTLRGRDAFEGIFAGAGLPASQRWSGVRDTGQGRADVPCRLAE